MTGPGKNWGGALWMAVCLIVGIVTVSSAHAQEAPLRAVEWAQLRHAKAEALAPDRHNPAHAALAWVRHNKVLERLAIPGAGWGGFRPAFAGLERGSGFGLGLQWDQLGIGRHVDLHAAARTSLIGGQRYDLGLEAPRLAGRRLSLGLWGSYSNRPEVDFFGLGSGSRTDQEVHFLVEETAVDLRLGWTPRRWLRWRAEAGLRHYNTGPADDGAERIEDVFDPVTIPGLIDQTEFERIGVQVELDTRNKPANPRAGSYFRAGWSRWTDVDLERHDFDRLSFDLHQYLPFTYGHRVIALRAHAGWDQPRGDHEVPFYVQQPLGGGLDLRGFEEYRFRDRGQLLLTAEYRWEAWVGLDGALFADAGKVFHDRRELDLDDLETAYGVGLRFDASRAVFLRLDLARSDEGTRLHVQFRHIF